MACISLVCVGIGCKIQDRKGPLQRYISVIWEERYECHKTLPKIVLFMNTRSKCYLTHAGRQTLLLQRAVRLPWGSTLLSGNKMVRVSISHKELRLNLQKNAFGARGGVRWKPYVMLHDVCRHLVIETESSKWNCEDCRSFQVYEHWIMQVRIRKNGNDSCRRTLKQLELLRNEMGINVL